MHQADILVVTSPIWLGEKSSICTKVIERLYANSHLLNEAGQYAYYGRVGGCLITGNEDGAKHCAMNILYSLQHLGYTVPPQASSIILYVGGTMTMPVRIYLSVLDGEFGTAAALSTILLVSTGVVVYFVFRYSSSKESAFV